MRRRARNWYFPAPASAVNGADCPTALVWNAFHVVCPGRSTWTSSTSPAGSGSDAHTTVIGVARLAVAGTETGTVTTPVAVDEASAILKLPAAVNLVVANAIGDTGPVSNVARPVASRTECTVVPTKFH